MEAIEPFLAQFRSSKGAGSVSTVLDTCRYKIMFQTEKFVYPLFALDKVIAYHNPTEIVIHTELDGYRFAPKLKDNQAFKLGNVGVILSYLKPRRFKSRSIENAKAFLKSAKFLAQHVGSLDSQVNQPLDVLFVENSPKSSIHSIKLAKHLKTEHDLNVFITSPSPEVIDRGISNGIPGIQYKKQLSISDFFKGLGIVSKTNYVTTHILQKLGRDQEFFQLATTWFYDEVRFVLQGILAEAAWHVLTAEKSVKLNRPKAVFSTSGGGLHSRAFFFTGQSARW